MAIARKIAYNVAFSSVAKVLSTLLALVVIGMITRYLGKEGFGNYATALAFLSFFAALADLGLYQISTREISRSGADEKKIIGNIFSLRLISSVAVFLISPAVVFFFDYPEEVKRGIIILAASFIFSSSYQVLNGVFQKNLAMDKVALGELVGKLIQVGAVFAAIKMNLGFDFIIGSMLFNMIANFAIIYILSKKYIRFNLRFDLDYWKTFLKESMPLGIGAIVVFLYFKIDTILLSVMKSSADVGIYGAAYKVLENITFFPAMIMGLIMPIMSQSIFSNRKKFEDISNKTFKIFLILTVPLIIGILFLAPAIMNIVGGSEFSESSDVLRILVFALSAIFFGMFFSSMLIAGNQQKKLLFVWVLAAIINIASNLLFIPKFSYFAAASASVGTEIFVAIATFVLVAKNLKYYPRPESFLKIAGSGAIMAGFLGLARDMNFFIAAVGSGLVYFLFLWLFKAVEASEITSIISKKGVKEYPGKGISA